MSLTTVQMTPARRNFLLTAMANGGRIRRVETYFGTHRFEAGRGKFPAALRDDLGVDLVHAGLIKKVGVDRYAVTEAGQRAAGVVS